MGGEAGLLGSLRKLLMPMISIGAAAFVEYQIMVKYPEEDPDDWETAAEQLNKIGLRIEESRVGLNIAALRVLTNNSGRGIKAFGRYWSTIDSYLSQVVDYCRRMAQACKHYADMLRATKHALVVLAVENAVALAWAIAWIWTGPLLAGPIGDWMIQRLYRKVQGEILVEVLEKTTMELFLEQLAEGAIRYPVGAAIYTIGDFSLADFCAGRLGDSPGSASDTATGMAKEFHSGLVFWAAWDGVWTGTRLGRMSKVFPETPWGNELAEDFSWIVGSTGWTVQANVDNGKNGSDVLPTSLQWLSKLAILTGQRGLIPR